MFLDLEPQEIVDSFKSLRISGRDLDEGAAICFLVFVTDLRLELRHDFASRWCFLVHKHGNLKVTLAEHHRDMPKMTANLITTVSVLSIVSLNLYRATVS